MGEKAEATRVVILIFNPLPREEKCPLENPCRFASKLKTNCFPIIFLEVLCLRTLGNSLRMEKTNDDDAGQCGSAQFRRYGSIENSNSEQVMQAILEEDKAGKFVS